MLNLAAPRTYRSPAGPGECHDPSPAPAGPAFWLGTRPHAAALTDPSSQLCHARTHRSPTGPREYHDPSAVPAGPAHSLGTCPHAAALIGDSPRLYYALVARPQVLESTTTLPQHRPARRFHWAPAGCRPARRRLAAARRRAALGRGSTGTSYRPHARPGARGPPGASRRPPTFVPAAARGRARTAPVRGRIAWSARKAGEGQRSRSVRARQRGPAPRHAAAARRGRAPTARPPAAARPPGRRGRWARGRGTGSLARRAAAARAVRGPRRTRFLNQVPAALRGRSRAPRAAARAAKLPRRGPVRGGPRWLGCDEVPRARGR